MSAPSERRVSLSVADDFFEPVAVDLGEPMAVAVPGAGTCALTEVPWLVQRISSPVRALANVLVVGTR